MEAARAEAAVDEGSKGQHAVAECRRTIRKGSPTPSLGPSSRPKLVPLPPR